MTCGGCLMAAEQQRGVAGCTKRRISRNGLTGWIAISHQCHRQWSDSYKNYDILLHSPASLFDLHGKAVQCGLPSPLLPFRHVASGLLVTTSASSCIFFSVALFLVGQVYPG